MKGYFFLFILTITVILLLSACDLSALGGGEAATTAPATTVAPGTTAAPVTTAGAVTAPLTTESPVTTAPVTTAPVTTAPIRQNPIVGVRELSSGALQVTLEDNTKTSLGSAPVREGYNSVECIAHSLDGGILTLTLRDSAALNIANEFLNAAPAPLTVRIREMGGNFEWAAVGSSDWRAFSSVKPAAAGNTVLSLLCEATEYGKADMPTEDRMILVISGNTLRFRARNWVEPGYDFCMNAELHYASSNGNFNFIRSDVIPSSTAEDSVAVSRSTQFKLMGDEIPPVSINGCILGSNHGYNLISATPNSAALRESDIGTVFTREGDSQRYVLVKATESELWFCPFDDDAMASGDFQKYVFGAKGMLAVGDILATESALSNGKKTLTASQSVTLKQLFSSTNHAEQHAYLNGTTEVDLTKDGVYYAEFVDFHETYDVYFLPAMLEHLIEDIGWNTNESYHGEDIEDAYFSFSTTHRFLKNGSYTVYETVTLKRAQGNVRCYGVMSGSFGEPDHYVYAAGSTTLGTPTLQENANAYAKGGENVRSYYQFTDTIGTKGMNVGYYPYFGIARNGEREAALAATNGEVGYWYTSYKMYPYLLKGYEMESGDSFSFIGYHVPTVKLDSDFFAVDWYFVGDEIYLQLHTDHAVSRKYVSLPNSDYLVGMTVTVDEATEGVTVHSTEITAGGIEIETDGAGYVFVKLTPAS